MSYKVINKLKKVFIDNENIKNVARNLQIKDPNKFAIIVSEMIKYDEITEQEFAKLYKENKTYEKREYIYKLYEGMMSLNIDPEKMDFHDLMKHIETNTFYEDLIFGSKYYYADMTCIIGETNYIDDEDYPYIEETEEVYKDKLNLEEEMYMEEVVDIYKNNDKNTCLYNVFISILENPEIARYIPTAHLEKLGLKGLFDESYDINSEIEDFKAQLSTLTILYLAYSKNYVDDYFIGQVVDAEKSNIERLITRHPNIH